MSDGVIDYVSGDKEAGASKIIAAARSNGRARIAPFARSLDQVAALPSISGFSDALRDVRHLLEDAEVARSSGGGDGTSNSPSPSDPRKVAASIDHAPLKGSYAASPMRTGTVVPGMHEHRKPCAIFGDPSATCVLILIGPAVVTDLQFGRACPDEMFVAVGDVASPHWFILSPASSPMSTTSAQFYVREDEDVFVGVRGALPHRDQTPECFVTWAAQKM